MNADATRKPLIATVPNAAVRSRRSLEFESMWRGLPRQGLLPYKRDFKPGGAASLLRYVMLLEVKFEPAPSLPIRLVGTALSERVQRDIKGHDYLEFLDQEYHGGAVASARLMFDRPCGLWQITPLHYERGIAQNVEVTAFPLLDEPHPFILVLTVPREEFVRPLSPGDRAMLVETATEFEFIDVGNGVPDRRPD
jgi:hypothetical protein